MILSGDASASWVVKEDSMSYSFTVPRGGTYIITPLKSGYAFTPPFVTYNKLSSKQTQNFTVKLASYTISGTVTGTDSVTVALSGDATGSWTVNNGGTYTFNVPAFVTYHITPAKSGWDFTPANKTFEIVIQDSEQNFDGYTLNYNILLKATNSTITTNGGTTMLVAELAQATDMIKRRRNIV